MHMGASLELNTIMVLEHGKPFYITGPLCGNPLVTGGFPYKVPEMHQ